MQAAPPGATGFSPPARTRFGGQGHSPAGAEGRPGEAYCRQPSRMRRLERDRAVRNIPARESRDQTEDALRRDSETELPPMPIGKACDALIIGHQRTRQIN